jgi:hypothetical protein
MRRPVRFGLALALAFALAFAGIAAGAPAQGGGGSQLQMYTATVDPGVVAKLVEEGYDVARIRRGAAAVQVELVLWPHEVAQLEAQGVRVEPWRGADSLTARAAAAAQAAAGYTVYRSYDAPGGIRDELYQIAREHRKIVQLVVIGHTIQGREIIALLVTKNADDFEWLDGGDDGAGRPTPQDAARARGGADDDGGARGGDDGRKAAVLYIGTQHAREWLATEVTRRLLRYYVDNYGTDPVATELVDSRRLWFVVVANPDGYQYTFDADRLWRKNLRDNNGDGQITSVDGVDPNRNFPEHWNYDDEGSSSLLSSQIYRGPGPASEPETRAMIRLARRVRPRMVINYHTYGNLILYSFGWQVQTPSADDPIYVALSGTDKNPAIAGYDPGVSAELYITNGETTDYMHAVAGALAWTVEISDGSGFTFPDDEALIQAEFDKVKPFSLDVARSAGDPARPVSHQGRTTKPFYLELASGDPEKANNPLSDFRFDVSYGDPQPVQVLARRDLGRVTLRYQINNGGVRSAATSEWDGGKRFGEWGDVYYRIMRGQVKGAQPGDAVKVWFEARGGRERSDAFTYTLRSDSNAPVLVMAAEDYTGNSPAQAPGPHLLSSYTSALEANDIRHDVYDVDANGRKAPHALGVLGHYRAVIWYTGNDIITRERSQGPGNASRLANDAILHVRAYLNEGGRVLYTGTFAGHQYFTGHGTQIFDPEANAPCTTPDVICDPLSNDFMQYYLGAYFLNEGAGTSGPGQLYPVRGGDTPFSSLAWTFNGADSANNQDHSASFLTTSGILGPATYPQFRSWVSGGYARPGGPFEPRTGQHYLYSQIADIAYKRLLRTITVPAGGATMAFWTSYDTEAHWDFMFVEAHTVGQDDWTTLPDLNGHTSPDTGESCQEQNSGGWRTIHRHLDHYQTQTGPATCSATGTTGQWHAASGNSGGWQQWKVDLSRFAGRQIEVSISFVSDWGTQGLGNFVDDIEVSTGEGSTSFEDGLAGWTTPGPPPGSSPNPNNWTRTTAAGFPEGAAITTEDTIYFGFGFEGITGAETRNAVMHRAMKYLLR